MYVWGRLSDQDRADAAIWDAIFAMKYRGDVYAVMPLIFHVAVLVNPNQEGYEHRYCFKDAQTAILALLAMEVHGKLRLWHKDHTRNLSVLGNKLYKSGYREIPENVVGIVDWTIEDKKGAPEGTP